MSTTPGRDAGQGGLDSPRPPKVFLSHAGEDKDRFVLEFATRLRARGIDVWVDDWEILPGDSLVQKVFDEGLKHADAVIVVLSEHSVEKPWVREELDAAVVKRINTGTKLIPVIIDDCRIPEALKALVWERVHDLGTPDDAVARVVAAVFEHHERPPIGDAPRYVSERLPSFTGLTKLDTLLLVRSAEYAIRTGNRFQAPSEVFQSVLEETSESEVEDSIRILEQQGIFEITVEFGRQPSPFRLTSRGFQTYIDATMPAFGDIVHSVALLLVNENVQEGEELAQRLKQPPFLVDHILKILADQGHIRIDETNLGILVWEVHPSLRRALSASE